MTAQINDTFLYQAREYVIAGISTGKLFDPSIFNLTPFATCSACWRGYQAVFAISDSRLILNSLYVSLITDEETYGHVNGPIINGIAPVLPQNDYDIFNNHYEGLNYNIEYTGGLLLADGFINELYVHMGFHPAWKFERVVELIFDAGLLKQEFVRSEKMAEIREKFFGSPGENCEDLGPASMDELFRFIDEAFDRSYDM